MSELMRKEFELEHGDRGWFVSGGKSDEYAPEGFVYNDFTTDMCWTCWMDARKKNDVENKLLRKDALRLRWLRQHEFDIGSYHGAHEHNVTAWFESVSDDDIDQMIAEESQFAEEFEVKP